MARKSLEALSTEAARLMRLWASEDAAKTRTLKQLAVVVVEIRKRFEADGVPDWRGRSYEYRMHMASVYEEAGLPKATEDRLQSLLKYHTGNLVRTLAPTEDLDALGLDHEAPKDRINQVRKEQQRIAEQFQIVQQLKASSSSARLVAAVEQTVAVMAEQMKEMKARPKDLNEVDEQLQKLKAIIEQALDHTQKSA